MAFPTIPTLANGRLLSNTQADTSGTRTFPSLSGLTKNSGDLLIAICFVYQSSASAGAVFSGWGGGFTEFLDVGGSTSNMSIGAAYKISTGSETGTFTVTQAATVTGHAGMFLLSIPGASGSIAPVGGTIVNGTTTLADITSLNPATWGTLDTLWIALAGSGETATAGSFTGVGTAPTNYVDIHYTGVSADVVGGVEGAVAFRQLNAASDDPGTFPTTDTSSARNSAVLIAVCPTTTAVSITFVQETDSAIGISGTTHVKSITTATETDSVGEIVPLQTLPATVTASAQPLSTQSGHGITPATTTASAQALTNIDKLVTITPVTETDTVLSRQKIITFVTETDSARPLTIQHNTFDIVTATETDLAGDIVELQPLPAGTTDTAQVLTFSQSGLHLTPATSTASAQLLSFTQGGGYAIARATETDLANQIVSLQPLPATVTASAQALSVIYGGKNIAPALESDSARSITPGAGINLVEWETTAPIPYNTRVAVGDFSTAVALSVSFGAGAHKSITPVTTTDTAQALTVRKAATLTLVSVTSTAPALSVAKARGITTATSTASALGLSFTQAGGVFHVIDPVVSTNTAVGISILKEIFVNLEFVTEHDFARFTRAANRPSGGLALIDHDPSGGLILIDHSESPDLALIDI